ncbi:ATP/GTP-binding protein family [Actinidia rufa]|uniref:ATP/GTP-binding protein family n=1 Tax=Actinidia rufa TaxID=165716 RepID=A0A7J0GJ68_9ERIC|nr:ATP/GTP-binding protein family [Actinidia rufa]
MSTKEAGPSYLENRNGYGSAIPDSTKLTTGDYTLSSSHGYYHKSDQLLSDKFSDYPSVDRYGGRQSAYAGRICRMLQQADMYERMDEALLLQQEQMLKAQSLQSVSLDVGSRQADYLAARGPSIHHAAQDLMSYGGRLNADPCSLSMLSASSYGGQHASSILGAAPQRNVDDLMYAQTSSNPGYGVSLPLGRDYATGKGLQDASLDLDYPRRGHSKIDERKDDRGGYVWELERREERPSEHLRGREKDREKEKERERERDREQKRERGPDVGCERTPPRISRDRAERLGSSLTKDVKPPQRYSLRHEALHRRRSPVKEKKREYDCKVKNLYKSSVTE